MIDGRTKTAINELGKTLALILPEFYGKVSFNIADGKYINSNVEQSIRPGNLKKGDKSA